MFLRVIVEQLLIRKENDMKRILTITCVILVVVAFSVTAFADNPIRVVGNQVFAKASFVQTMCDKAGSPSKFDSNAPVVVLVGEDRRLKKNAYIGNEWMKYGTGPVIKAQLVGDEYAFDIPEKARASEVCVTDANRKIKETIRLFRFNFAQLGGDKKPIRWTAVHEFIGDLGGNVLDNKTGNYIQYPSPFPKDEGPWRNGIVLAL
jgi:hypothetical protein